MIVDIHMPQLGGQGRSLIYEEPYGLGIVAFDADPVIIERYSQLPQKTVNKQRFFACLCQGQQFRLGDRCGYRILLRCPPPDSPAE